MADANGGEGIMPAEEKEKVIFEGVFFAVVPSSGLRPAEAEKLVETLQKHGATHCPLGSNELRHITHLISTTSDFPAYHDAVDGFIHVVKPSWVEQSVLKKRTANPRQFSPDSRFFLSEVVVTCTEDIPQGDKDAIVGGVQAMGGQYSAALTKLVTHIVALSMNNTTCKLATEKKLRAKPVLPHWFDDCLRLGKKIDHTPYLLPDPPILNMSKSPGPPRSNPDLEGASQFEPGEAPQTSTPPLTPSDSRQKLSVFTGYKVRLHADLGLSEHLEQSIADLIRKGGGEAVKQMEEANMLICYGRGSSEFKSASRAGKDVGNLNWLYYLINHNTWTSPTRRLLHYPYPNGGIPGFEKLKISVSNYAGEARVYLESLVKAAGGSFTKSMMQENTHLITAHTFSEKCEAAREWNIKMVNHLWLEESYAQCAIQAETNARYTTFPKQTNLGEVVGQTQIDRMSMEALYFPLKSTQSRRDQLESISVNSNRPRTPSQISASKKKTQQTPTLAAPGTTNEVSGGSRSAKSRALDKLHTMAPDIALFEKESKRVGGVVYGGRRVNDPDRIKEGRKRSADSNEIKDVTMTDSEEDEPRSSPAPNKKQKPTAPATWPRVKVLVTGWDTKAQHQHYQQKTKPLNVVYTDDPTTPFDVLAAPKILRTRKFLSGVAQAPTVVSINWLSTMLSKNQRLPLEDYKLNDPASERTIGFTLEDSLRRAKANKEKGGMLKDWTIFCTENAHGGFEAHNEIIRANGGRCLLFKGRETKVKRRPKQNETTEDDEDVEMSDGEEETLHLITTQEDKSLWKRFRDMADVQGFQAKLCKADWMLRIALSQNVDEWQDDWEWRDEDA